MMTARIRLTTKDKTAVDKELIRSRLKSNFPSWVAEIRANNPNIDALGATEIKQLVNLYVVRNLSPRYGILTFFEKSSPPEDLYGTTQEKKKTWWVWEEQVVSLLYDALVATKKAKIALANPKATLDIFLMQGLKTELDARDRFLENINLTLWWRDEKGIPSEIPIDRVGVDYDEVSSPNLIVNINKLYPTGLARLVQKFGEEPGALTEFVNKKIQEGDFIIGKFNSTRCQTLGIDLQLFGKKVG